MVGTYRKGNAQLGKTLLLPLQGLVGDLFPTCWVSLCQLLPLVGHLLLYPGLGAGQALCAPPWAGSDQRLFVGCLLDRGLGLAFVSSSGSCECHTERGKLSHMSPPCRWQI